MKGAQREKLWLFGAGVAALLMTLVGWLFFISPQRAQTATVDDQVMQLAAQNSAAEQRVAMLAEQEKNLPHYRQQLARAELALPSGSGLPAFLRTLQSIGDATSTNVSDVSVGDPSPAGPSPSAPAALPATSTSATGTSSVTAAPTTSAAPALYALPVTADVTGSLPHLRDFLTQLQKVQPRAVLVQQAAYSTVSGSTSGGASLQLTLQAFIAPPPPGAEPASATPLPTATAVPSATAMAGG